MKNLSGLMTYMKINRDLDSKNSFKFLFYHPTKSCCQVSRSVDDWSC